MKNGGHKRRGHTSEWVYNRRGRSSEWVKPAKYKECAVRCAVSTILQKGLLDYGNILLVGSAASDIQRLQLLQNWAARLMFQVGRRDHVSPLLRKLHWLPMKQRINFKVLCFVYKWFIGVSPSYLSSCLALYIPGHEGLRSATDTTRLQEHSTNSRCLLSAADKAFYFYGPCLWNQLPRSVRTATSLPGFKKALKTHLFSKI